MTPDIEAFVAEPDDDRLLDGTLIGAAPFAIPTLPDRLVDRDEVLDLFDAGAALTVVEALPGYGKTTVVARLAHRQRDRGWHVAWLDGSSGMESVVDRARVALTSPDEPVLLVIDDLQRLDDDTATDELLSLLADRGNLRVVVCTRGIHPIRVKALSRSLEVSVISGRQLAITRERVRELAELWGHTLDPERADALYELTGGWPLVIRLILVDSAPRYDPFVLDTVRELLKGIVAPPLVGSERLRLAARLAVPEELTEAFAHALLDPVLGHAEATCNTTPLDVVEYLETSGTLERIAGGGWGRRWRFPTIIRHALLTAFESRGAGDLVECHRIVAKMLLESDVRPLYGQAMMHARSAEAWDLLARLWAENGLLLGVEFRVEAVNAFTDIPQAVLDDSPSLAQASAVLGVLATDTHPDLRDLMHAFTAGGGPALADLAALSSANEVALTGTAAMALLRSEGRLDLASAFGGRLALELGARRRRGDVVNRRNDAWVLLQRGVTELIAGRSENATAMATKAFHSRPRNVVDPIAASSAGYLSMMYAMRGIVEESRRWQEVHRSRGGSGSWLDPLISIPGRVARALLALDQLDRATVDRELDGLEDEVPPVATWSFITHAAVRRSLLFGQPRRRLMQLDRLQHAHALELSQSGVAARIVSRSRAELLLSVGELNRAARYIDEVGPASAWLQASRARLHLIAGNDAEARRIATTGGWNNHVSFRDRVELFAIDALASLRMGDRRAASEAFSHAHELGAGLGMLGFRVAMPADEHAELMGLIGAELDAHQSARLGQVRTVYPKQADLVMLSPRERTVLQEMTRHDSVQGIAQALTVSVNTVKKQRVSIYAKLGVHDRAEALLRASQLGLLDDPAASRT